MAATAVDYPPTAVGHPPTAVGYPANAVGHPSNAVGYPANAVGYPTTTSIIPVPEGGTKNQTWVPPDLHRPPLPKPTQGPQTYLAAHALHPIAPHQQRAALEVGPAEQGVPVALDPGEDVVEGGARAGGVVVHVQEGAHVEGLQLQEHDVDQRLPHLHQPKDRAAQGLSPQRGPPPHLKEWEGEAWRAGLWGWGRDALEGGGAGPPPPSRAPSLWPATVSLTASARLNGICNRQ